MIVIAFAKKHPSYATISGEHSYLDMYLITEFSSISFIHSGHR